MVDSGSFGSLPVGNGADKCRVEAEFFTSAQLPSTIVPTFVPADPSF